MRALIAVAWLLVAVTGMPFVPAMPAMPAMPFASAAHAAPASPATLATPAATPQRIVSLVPSLTEAVCMLQACDRLVGVDRHSNWPASVQSLPRLGGLDDTPLEALIALRPDLVLAPPGGRLNARLSELGIAVLSLPTNSHDDVHRALQQLGTRLARSDEAQRLWQQAQSDIARAAERVPSALRGRRVYVEVSSEPHAAGPASFIGQTLARLGLLNIVPESMGPFPRLNPEFIVRAQPQVVVAPAASLAKMTSRPGWSALPALRHSGCGLPPEEWEVLVRPGPRLGEAAAVLARCLNRVHSPP